MSQAISLTYNNSKETIEYLKKVKNIYENEAFQAYLYVLFGLTRNSLKCFVVNICLIEDQKLYVETHISVYPAFERAPVTVNINDKIVSVKQNSTLLQSIFINSFIDTNIPITRLHLLSSFSEIVFKNITTIEGYSNSFTITSNVTMNSIIVNLRTTKKDNLNR